MNQGELVRWPVPPGVPRWGALLRWAPRPASAALLAAALTRPAGSPLRRRLLTDTVRVGMDLLNRRDDRVLRFYDPAFEIHVGAGFPLDMEPVYRGHAGWRAVMRLWDEAAAVSFVAEEVLDMGGPCLGLLVSVRLTGSESGASPAPVQSVWTYTVRRGRIVRHDVRQDGWDAGPAQLAVALQRLTPATEKPSSTPV